MTRTAGRARWLSTLTLALMMVLLPAPSTAADTTGAPATAPARLAWTTTSVAGDANLLALTSTLLRLLGQAVSSLDDTPWVPADRPHALPLNLTPPLPIADTIRNRAYSDGCHAPKQVRKARACTYGDRASDFKVLLMGDSHGAMWLPAFEAIAARRGWRIYLLTKSACPPALLHVIAGGRVYTDCDAWRTSAFRVIRRLKPDLAVVTSTSGYEIVGIARKYSKPYLAAWRKGWADAMRTIGRSAGEVVVFSDTPSGARPPIACLRKHRTDVRKCATPRVEALRPDLRRGLRQAAGDAEATFVDPSVLVCPDDPCGVVDGRFLKTYDISHLTPAYARLLSARLEAMLPIPGE
jgi:hypothetical protein